MADHAEEGHPDRADDIAGLLINLAHSVRDREPGDAAKSALEIAAILRDVVPALTAPSALPPRSEGGDSDD
jgi:hypothetical protein